MGRLTGDKQRVLAGEFMAAVTRIAPEWTNQPDPDPGVTLVELFAWLLDNLAFGETTASERKRAVLRQALEKLNALLRDNCTSTNDLTRPRYFTGQLLTAADFQAEQDYVREKVRRHNRCMFGFGVVTGLQVTLESNSETSDQPLVTISPGCAIDPNGEQITVCERLCCTLHPHTSAGYVIVRYCEQTINPVPVDGSSECSRIEEGVAVEFEPNLPTDGVAIARLEHIEGKWMLDSQFRHHTIRLAREGP
jgi:hypothetical protein